MFGTQKKFRTEREGERSESLEPETRILRFLRRLPTGFSEARFTGFGAANDNSAAGLRVLGTAERAQKTRDQKPLTQKT